MNRTTNNWGKNYWRIRRNKWKEKEQIMRFDLIYRIPENMFTNNSVCNCRSTIVLLTILGVGQLPPMDNCPKDINCHRTFAPGHLPPIKISSDVRHIRIRIRGLSASKWTSASAVLIFLILRMRMFIKSKYSIHGVPEKSLKYVIYFFFIFLYFFERIIAILFLIWLIYIM